MANKTSVYPIQENTIVDVGSTPVEILIEDKTQTIESTTQEHPVEIVVPATTVYTAGVQGPAGPPTGLFEDIDNLAFIGSGTGATKTVTGNDGNIIFEEFGVLDELFVLWALPKGLDRTKDCYFEGSFFLLADDTGKTSSWEIHVTAHEHDNGSSATGTIYATDLPLKPLAYDHTLGSAPIDHTTYLGANIDVLHIRLKRVASTSDPSGKIGVSDVTMRYATDGKVGTEGDTGPEGPAGGLDAVPFEYTATQGQTVITGPDNNANTLLYTLGSMSISINGVELLSDDYAETDTGTITLNEPCYVNDTIEILAFAQGEVGGGTASFDYIYTAGENLSAGRAVRVSAGSVYYADKDITSHMGAIIGLVKTTVTSGNPATVTVGGEVTDGTWTWSAGAVFLGDDGNLTQVVPTAGFVQKIGTATSATTLLIDIDDPVLRA